MGAKEGHLKERVTLTPPPLRVGKLPPLPLRECTPALLSWHQVRSKENVIDDTQLLLFCVTFYLLENCKMHCLATMFSQSTSVVSRNQVSAYRRSESSSILLRYETSFKTDNISFSLIRGYKKTYNTNQRNPSLQAFKTCLGYFCGL